MRVGRAFPGGGGLALAMVVAGACCCSRWAWPTPAATCCRRRVLATGAAVAVLSSVIPYSLELEALRRMPPSVFGVLMSLEPALATLAG